jgi:hypothetical protein
MSAEELRQLLPGQSDEARPPGGEVAPPTPYEQALLDAGADSGRNLVVVVDDHITGVLTEHQAGKVLGLRPSGLRIRGRRSTPGRYFQVANPGAGWGDKQQEHR